MSKITIDYGSENADIVDTTNVVDIDDKAKNTIKNKTKDDIDLANIISQSLIQYDKFKKQEELDTAIIKERANIARNTNLAGLATSNFAKEKQAEIANGDYIDIQFYPSLSKKFGNVFNYTINGYTMHFFKQRTTRIPKSLASQIIEMFNQDKDPHNNFYKNIIVSRDDNTMDDNLKKEAIDQLSSIINI